MGSRLTSLCFLQPMCQNKFGYEINLHKLNVFLLLVSLLTYPQPVPGAGHAYYLLWILLALKNVNHHVQDYFRILL